MNIIRFCLFIMAVLFSAQIFAVSTEAALSKVVDEYKKEHQFNGNVLITQNGRDVFFKAVGLADRSHDVLINRSSKFLVGSVSKQFTATAILKLEEQGLLKTTDTISSHITVPAIWNDVTIHELLTHTSGLPLQIPVLNEHFGKIFFLKDLALTILNTHELKGRGKFHYSNAGYTLLAYIVEQVGGRSFGEFTDAFIYKKLNLASTGEFNHGIIYPGLARGYRKIEGQIYETCCVILTNWIGAGTAYSTVDDLRVWIDTLFKDDFLREDLREKLVSEHIKIPDLKPSGHYGYGWITQILSGEKQIWHNGNIAGFYAELAAIPSNDYVIIILANQDDYPSTMYTKKMREDLTRVLLEKSKD